MSRVPSSLSRSLKPCKKAGFKPIVKYPDGVPCPICSKLNKNQLGLTRHMQRGHREAAQPDDSEADSPVNIDPKPDPSGKLEATKRMMTSLASGTEVVGEVEDGVMCGVCLLKVEKNAYAGHLAAHVEAAKLQYAYLGEVLERTAASVRNLNS